MIIIKGDSISDGTYLDNKGQYSYPLESTIPGGIIWNDVEWDTTTWEGLPVSVVTLSNIVRYSDPEYLETISNIGSGSTIDTDLYYTKDEIDVLIEEAQELSIKVYDGSITPIDETGTYVIAGSILALDELGRVPAVDGRNITNIGFNNVSGL